MDNHVWRVGTRFHRLYVFCLRIWATFVRHHPYEREMYVENRKLNTDICFLAKVVPGALFVVILNIVAYLCIPVAIILSFVLLGVMTVIKTGLIFVGAFLVFGLICFLIYFLSEPSDIKEACKMYYKSIKERTCFLIKFNQNGESNHV